MFLAYIYIYAGREGERARERERELRVPLGFAVYGLDLSLAFRHLTCNLSGKGTGKCMRRRW